MNARVLPRIAVTSALKLVRLPLDGAVRLLPGDGTGPGAAAKLALDRTDATVRALVALILRDPTLGADAEARQQAARERQRGAKLRTQAERTAQEADERVEGREKQARERRERAVRRERSRRQEADHRAQESKRRAAKSEGKRRETSRRIEERRDEAIAEREPRERLDVLEAKSEALREKDHEIAARDEAQRLAEAASRTKAQRKRP